LIAFETRFLRILGIGVYVEILTGHLRLEGQPALIGQDLEYFRGSHGELAYIDFLPAYS
jgi:hypothetical protein